MNTIALNHIGEIRSGGGGSKPSPIPQWIREHVVFYYDVKKQGATNETLKESAYLQDLSGKGRRMKLNNFLFAEMSGVGGYNDNFSNWRTQSSIVEISSSEKVVIKKISSAGYGAFHKYLDIGEVYLKCNITGITKEIEGKVLFQYNNNGIKRIALDNGVFEFNSKTQTDGSNWVGFTSTEPIDNCNITITQIPEYPGALVTDGVDDYGLVENLSSGVKMLFMTVNPMASRRYLYEQRKDTSSPYAFAIVNFNGTIAYNSRNTDGKTYIDGILNTKLKTEDLLNKKQIITMLNSNVSESVTKQPVFWRSLSEIENMKCAFYNSIAFDSIPTEADGFTEQELIDYVITNIIGQ